MSVPLYSRIDSVNVPFLRATPSSMLCKIARQQDCGTQRYRGLTATLSVTSARRPWRSPPPARPSKRERLNASTERIDRISSSLVRYRWLGTSGRWQPYADLFDSDLDALADVLDQHRTAALQPSIANSDSETDEENVPGTLQQSA
jgi:hypothetical protein